MASVYFQCVSCVLSGPGPVRVSLRRRRYPAGLDYGPADGHFWGETWRPDGRRSFCDSGHSRRADDVCLVLFLFVSWFFFASLRRAASGCVQVVRTAFHRLPSDHFLCFYRFSSRFPRFGRFLLNLVNVSPCFTWFYQY